VGFVYDKNANFFLIDTYTTLNFTRALISVLIVKLLNFLSFSEFRIKPIMRSTMYCWYPINYFTL